MAEAKAKAQSEKKSEETKQGQPSEEKAQSGVVFSDEQIAVFRDKVMGPALKDQETRLKAEWKIERQRYEKRIEELHGEVTMKDEVRKALANQIAFEAFLVESEGVSEAEAKSRAKPLFDALKSSEKPDQGFDISKFLSNQESSSEEQPKGEKPVARSPAPPGGIGLGRREDIRFDAKGGHVKALKEIVEEQTAEADRKRGFR